MRRGGRSWVCVSTAAGRARRSSNDKARKKLSLVTALQTKANATGHEGVQALFRVPRLSVGAIIIPRP